MLAFVCGIVGATSSPYQEGNTTRNVSDFDTPPEDSPLPEADTIPGDVRSVMVGVCLAVTMAASLCLMNYVLGRRRNIGCCCGTPRERDAPVGLDRGVNISPLLPPEFRIEMHPFLPAQQGLGSSVSIGSYQGRGTAIASHPPRRRAAFNSIVLAESRPCSPPAHMICPISLALMSDPVRCVDGHHSFDRAYLEYHLRTGRPECPISRKRMVMEDVEANDRLRAEIEMYVECGVCGEGDHPITYVESDSDSGSDSELGDDFTTFGLSRGSLLSKASIVRTESTLVTSTRASVLL